MHGAYMMLIDYFAIISIPQSPTTSSPLHDITPCHPDHPLLAQRELYSSGHFHTNMAANLMSVQTSAAHGHSPSPTRPRPTPMQQNVLWTNSDDSTSSSESGETSMEAPVARCSRCQRTPSVDIQSGKSNMVSYGRKFTPYLQSMYSSAHGSCSKQLVLQ